MIVLNVFLDIIMPVVLVILCGMALCHFKKTAIEPISQAALYLFSPALVLLGMADTDLPLESMGKIVAFGALLTVAMYVISRVVGFALRMDRAAQSSVLLAVLVMNAGNLSLPIVSLAFGDAGLDRALVLFAVIALSAATLGVYIAAHGQQGGAAAFKAVLQQPIAYAAVGGLALNLLGLELPSMALNATELLANAAFPAMLMVLGGNLLQHRGITEWRTVAVATALRLWVGLAVGYGLLLLLGVDELTRNALLVTSCAPTAVIVIVLSTEFNARPAVATGAVVVTTVLSLPTLTALLSILTR
ncbi:MAG: AEC family transporter [Chloroflexota bacterium]|nr:AEC family transporter [Chloroflexota bacterium]MDE2969197.1 AEC family transporter [Chloroflexota bacterium]